MGDDGQLIVYDDGCVIVISIVELNFRLKGVVLKLNVLDKKLKEVGVVLDKLEDYEGLDLGELVELVNDVSKLGVKKQGVGVEDELRQVVYLIRLGRKMVFVLD